MKKQILILSFIGLGMFTQGWAQQQTPATPVGIGTRTPDKTAIVHMESTTQGFLMPRLTGAQRDAITNNNPNAPLGLTIYNTDNNCIESWTGPDGGWVGNCGTPKATLANINCAGAIISNTPFQVGTDVASTIIITADVTKGGSWTGNGGPKVANGYLYNGSGFLPQGSGQTLQFTGVGRPLNYTAPNYDTILLNVNGTPVGCPIKALVNDAPHPNYDLVCSSISINSSPAQGQSVTGNIQLKITVNSSNAAGVAYQISTDSTDGFWYSAIGSLPTSPNGIYPYTTTVPITLNAGGSPKSANGGSITKTIKCNSSSTGTTTCSATLPILFAKLTIAGFGSNGGYGYIAMPTGASNNFLASSANFGTTATSTVKTQGFSFPNYQNTGADITAYLASNNPDIVIIGNGYDLSSSTRRNAVNNYLANKGVVIYISQDNGSSQVGPMLDLVFNTTGTTVASTGGADYYQILNVGDIITNGPFGNMAGKYMGDDYDASYTITSALPADAVVYANYNPTPVHNNNNGKPVIVGSKSKSFIFIGDKGFIDNGASDGTHGSTVNPPTGYANQEPFFLNGSPNYQPAVKYYGTSAGYQPIYNSFLFGNIMQWAINKATTNGINYH